MATLKILSLTLFCAMLMLTVTLIGHIQVTHAFTLFKSKKTIESADKLPEFDFKVKTPDEDDPGKSVNITHSLFVKDEHLEDLFLIAGDTSSRLSACDTSDTPGALYPTVFNGAHAPRIRYAALLTCLVPVLCGLSVCPDRHDLPCDWAAQIK
jgi:hypothetical protein